MNWFSVSFLLITQPRTKVWQADHFSKCHRDSLSGSLPLECCGNFPRSFWEKCRKRPAQWGDTYRAQIRENYRTGPGPTGAKKLQGAFRNFFCRQKETKKMVVIMGRWEEFFPSSSSLPPSASLSGRDPPGKHFPFVRPVALFRSRHLASLKKSFEFVYIRARRHTVAASSDEKTADGGTHRVLFAQLIRRYLMCY